MASPPPPPSQVPSAKAVAKAISLLHSKIIAPLSTAGVVNLQATGRPTAFKCTVVLSHKVAMANIIAAIIMLSATSEAIKLCRRTEPTGDPLCRHGTIRARELQKLISNSSKCELRVCVCACVRKQ